MGPSDVISAPADNNGVGGGRPPLLSPDKLSSILTSIELITAMWSGSNELYISSQDEESIRNVSDFLQLPLNELGNPQSVRLRDSIPTSIELTLLVNVDQGRKLAVVVTVPFRANSRSGFGNGSLPSFRIANNIPPALSANPTSTSSSSEQDSWLTRSLVDQLNQILNKYSQQQTKKDEDEDDEEQEEEEDIATLTMSAIEDVSEFVLALPSLPPSSADAARTSDPNASSASTSTYTSTTTNNVLSPSSSQTQRKKHRVRRSWYYLPSLSSKSKRKDIVQLANHFDPPLSGFLLAGKPGLIVLEYPLPDLPASSSTTTSNNGGGGSGGTVGPNGAGAGAGVVDTASIVGLDKFWGEIKSVSWSDIPSSHKKIREVYVEASLPHASFVGFEDITDLPDLERGPDRGRKTDLSKLVTYLDGKGIDGKHVLENCLGVDWS